MKPVTLFVIVFFAFCLTSTAQIQVSPFEVKGESDVSHWQEIKAPEATSNCGEIKISMSHQLMSGGCAGTMVLTFSYSDDCRHTAQAQQYIRLTDMTPPAFVDPPQNREISSLVIPMAPQVEAIDNNGLDVAIETREMRGPDRIIRTWIATDSCGNQSIHEQVLTMVPN
jgi:hypothetical protein